MEKVRYIRSSHYWIHYKLSAQPLPRGGPDQWAGDVYCDHLECWSLSFRLDMMPGRYELTYIAPCGFVASLTSIEETHTPQSCMEKAIEGERRRSSIQVVRTSPPPGDPISGLGMSNPYIHTFRHAGLLLLRSIETHSTKLYGESQIIERGGWQAPIISLLDSSQVVRTSPPPGRTRSVGWGHVLRIAERLDNKVKPGQ